MAQPINILITVCVCPVVTTCHLSHCSCVWLCHSTFVHPWTNSVLTLYCIIRVKYPSSHVAVTVSRTPTALSIMLTYKTSTVRITTAQSVWLEVTCNWLQLPCLFNSTKHHALTFLCYFVKMYFTYIFLEGVTYAVLLGTSFPRTALLAV
jgi:hypothetical protein